jgi:hypothetical protein
MHKNALALTAVLACAAASAAEDEQLKENPSGWQTPGELKGKRILMVTWYSEGGKPDSVPLDHVPQILRKMGFTVDVQVSPKHLPDLEKYDQAWVISGGYGAGFGGTDTFDESDLKKLKEFVKRGKGVYSLNDNVPAVREGNMIGKAFHGIEMSGDYYGGKMIHVVAAGEVAKMVEAAKKSGDLSKLAELRRAGMLNGKLYAEDHELLSGIERIMEGVTICHMTPSPDLEVILRASDNQALVAVSKRPAENMLYDCGFTRMYVNWPQHQDTATRWYQNVALYLQGKRRADLGGGAKGAQP